MVSYDYDFFAFSAKEIEELFRLNGKNISALWAKKLREGTEGWFFGISAFLNHYAAHKSFDEVFRCGEFDLYEYFNARIWDGFGEEVKSFLLKIGHLVEFDEEQAMMVCGNHDIKQMCIRDRRKYCRTYCEQNNKNNSLYAYRTNSLAHCAV